MRYDWPALLITDDFYSPQEVLLAVLIKDFRFSPSNKEIVWKLGVAEAPTVEGKQSLPILVSRTISGS